MPAARVATNSAGIETKTENYSKLFNNCPGGGRTSPGGPEIQIGALPVEHNRSARGVALLQCIQAGMTFSENFKISIINFRAISEDKGLKF